MNKLKSKPPHGDGSFTLAEWCAHRRISRTSYYNMREDGTAPRIHHVGRQVRISAQADADWVAKREAAGAA